VLAADAEWGAAHGEVLAVAPRRFDVVEVSVWTDSAPPVLALGFEANRALGEHLQRPLRAKPLLFEQILVHLCLLV
jgi:hypothetical protein